MKSGYKIIIWFFSALILTACGGGGDLKKEGDTPITPPPPVSDNYVITKPILLDSNGVIITEVSRDKPGTLTAALFKNGVALAQKRIDFTLDGKGVLGADSALTDANGVAVISLLPGSTVGAGTVTASASVNGVEVATANLDFASKGDGDGGEVGNIQISVVLLHDSGEPIQSITATTSGTAVATVTGINKPTIVAFESDIGDLPIKTAVTNDQGIASVKIFSGSSLGAGTITATIGTGETGDTVVVIGATNLTMGSGEPFEAEKASVSTTQLSAGGTATISVKVQDENGNAYTQPIEVNFSSRCSVGSTAQADISSPVPTVNGIATTTYLAKGCVGADPINVTALAGGISLSAAAEIEVLQSDVGSIAFISSVPEMLTIKGTGNQETAVVKFLVRDEDGNPVPNQEVDFSLNTNVGGLKVNPTRATTNNEGIVQTVVNTGVVPTSVRVTATVVDSNPIILGQSSQLVVSTGLPDQDSFTLSATVLNPEALNIVDAEVTIKALLADAFNNPAPDGTVVYFTTEGGSIGATCQTENGRCEVEWRSQLPAPIGTVLDVNGQQTDGVLVSSSGLTRNPIPQLSSDSDSYFGGNFYKGKYGGRVTISAYAVGEESFPDVNGNGRFDESEMSLFLTQPNVSGLPFDIADPYVDFNEDRLYNPSQAHPSGIVERVGGEIETLVPWYDDLANDDGVFDEADGKYNGVLCALDDAGNNSHEGCADGINNPKSARINRSIVLVMSGSTPYATPVEDTLIFDSEIGGDTNNSLDIVGKGTASVTFTISDVNNQQMPAGTIVRFKASAGSVASATEYSWPSSNHNGGRDFTVTVKGAEEPDEGVLLVEVETPSGVKSEVLAIGVNII